MMRPDIEKLLNEVHALFKADHLSLSVAESCTGGLISHYITSLPGASTFFRAGIIAYSEKAKKDILRVSDHVLHTFGMVSKEAAAEMADQARKITGSDYSISTTGNLGPDVLENKEVGLIYLAVSRREETITRELKLTGDRQENKEEAALSALTLLSDVVSTYG